MYCPACGSQVSEGLRYCNHCGENLIAETSRPPRLTAIILVLGLAVLLVGVTGLAAIFLFAVEFLGRGNIPVESVLFLIVFTLVFFGVEALLIRQLSRLISVYLQTGSTAPKKKHSVGESKSQNQLTEARQTFVQTESQHITAPDESEQTTRILQTEEPTTRRLEKEE
jgi:predicted nucleic acid-binding Zn ribbon protein